MHEREKENAREAGFPYARLCADGLRTMHSSVYVCSAVLPKLAWFSFAFLAWSRGGPAKAKSAWGLEAHAGSTRGLETKLAYQSCLGMLGANLWELRVLGLLEAADS